ncbi:hypothetical protein CLOM_g24336 [Closterium sp. NIES-68]|nr:hypothetical protein CLOM_g24336 [Closterium sp. NIES-68]GJP84799.1 hypothetical protein CLOP_g14851 [Closterium sp. NIES-67]
MPPPVPPPPCAGDTLCAAAVKVLRTADPWRKADYGDLAAKLWASGAIRDAYAADDARGCESLNGDGTEDRCAETREDGAADAGVGESDEERWLSVPDRPARDDTVRVVAARDMPRRGKGGSQQSRLALLHSLVHIESWAVDLAWDIIARFGRAQRMPRTFFSDFVQVAADEARHFRLLAARLQALGSNYGALPAHDGLWESAAATAGDLKARLAIEHCVHEARGLDVVPQTIERFRAGGDSETAELLERVVYPEEITHCAAGRRWFTFLCLREVRGGRGAEGGEGGGCGRGGAEGEAAAAEGGSTRETATAARVVEGDGAGGEGEVGAGRKDEAEREEQSIGEEEASVEEHAYIVGQFHAIVRANFRGKLKPPFNHEAREKAGFTRDWYEALAE